MPTPLHHPMFCAAAAAAAAAWLLLSLAGTIVRAVPVSSTIQTVQASDCRPQSNTDDLIFSGCTTINSPSPGLPWCLLKTSGVQVLCDVNSLPQRSALILPAVDRVPCLQSAAVPGKTGLVYGCYTVSGVGSQLKCDTGAPNGMQPCVYANATWASADSSTESSFSKMLPGPATIAGMPKVGAYGVGVGLVVLPAAAGAFFVVRRRRTKRRNAEGGPRSAMGSYRRSSSMLLPAMSSSSSSARSLGRPSAAYQPRSSSAFMDSIAELPSSARVEGSLGRFVVALPHSPTLDDELVIKPGDVVEVLHEFDDGWCSAVNISRGMAQGLFPMHCIDNARGRVDD